MSATSLSEELLRDFNITNVLHSCGGGQKYVFIVEIDNHKYALKIFKDYGEREKRELDFYERFKTLPFIPKVFKNEIWKNNIILIEHYIEGSSLEKIKRNYSENHLTIATLLKSIITTMTPLWLDHIVHRDLKPDNIIIDLNQNPHIIDFGIARDLDGTTITDTGFQPNSWRYAGPEQIEGIKNRISYRTGFFSLGVIAYDLYYQKLPFANSKPELETKIQERNLKFASNPDCKLNSFFNYTLHYNISERANKPELLLEALSL